MKDLENIIRELQELKRVRTDQDLDHDIDSNPLSLRIQAEVVPRTLKIPKENFDGTTNPTDYVVAFESHIDLYGIANAIKCRAFPTTFKVMARS